MIKDGKTTEYVFRRNFQGDVTHIYKLNADKTLSLAARYKYDAWGNCEVEEIDGSGIGAVNPIRYRSYYFDTETGLYYLNARYYDPETGRFISADDTKFLNPDAINGLNLFAYCGNKPVMNVDPSGRSFVALLVSVLIGAAIGAVSYTVSVAAEYFATGEWNWSWGMFLGNVLGGAIGGALGTINPYLGALVTGLFSQAIGMGLQNAFGEASYSFEEIVWSSLFAGALSVGSYGIISHIKIPGFNSGRNSLSAVSRQIFTKLKNSTISKITMSTFKKMFYYELGNSTLYTMFAAIANVIIYYVNKNKKGGDKHYWTMA